MIDMFNKDQILKLVDKDKMLELESKYRVYG